MIAMPTATQPTVPVVPYSHLLTVTLALFGQIVNLFLFKNMSSKVIVPYEYIID